MRFNIFASAVALATTALAAPAPTLPGLPTLGCVNQLTAQQLISRFTQAFQLLPSDLGSANQTLQYIVADQFQEISDSILSLEGRPLGGPSETSKQSYINGLLHAPPTTGIYTTQVSAVGCSQVLWQWTFTGVGSTKYEVKGFNLFDLNWEGQITTLFVEFNSIAWGLDTGYKIIFPAGGPP